MNINYTYKSFVAIIQLLRPKQWLKNGFVFLPLIFSGTAWDHILLFNSTSAFILFCLAACVVYILNDIYDLNQDAQHPIKSKQRPLATGAIGVKTAVFILFILYAVIILQLWLFPEIFKIILIYIILNIFYTFILKKLPVIDIFVISLGFMLRVVAGSIAVFVPISSWMLITTLSLSLYMVSIKRRQEIALFETFKVQRTSYLSKIYDQKLLDRYAEIAGTCTFIFYTMYVLLIKPKLLVTVPLVMFGLFRYWYIVETLNITENSTIIESPTDLILRDWPLALSLVLWLVFCTYTLN